MSAPIYPPPPMCPLVSQSYDPRVVPSPPRLHWGWVLALQIFTLGMFGYVWLIV